MGNGDKPTRGTVPLRVVIFDEEGNAISPTNPLETKITDGITPVHVSTISEGLVVEDAISHLVHHGRLFTASYLFTEVADNGYAYLRVKVHADYHAFLNFSVETEAKVLICFYEGATFSAPGTIVPAYNNDRSSSEEAKALIYHTPTVSDNGTCLRKALRGTAGKFTESSGSAASVYARKLKKGTEYLIAAQNKGGDPKDIAIRVRFFEIGA